MHYTAVQHASKPTLLLTLLNHNNGWYLKMPSINVIFLPQKRCSICSKVKPAPFIAAQIGQHQSESLGMPMLPCSFHDNQIVQDNDAKSKHEVSFHRSIIVTIISSKADREWISRRNPTQSQSQATLELGVPLQERVLLIVMVMSYENVLDTMRWCHCRWSPSSNCEHKWACGFGFISLVKDVTGSAMVLMTGRTSSDTSICGVGSTTVAIVLALLTDVPQPQSPLDHTTAAVSTEGDDDFVFCLRWICSGLTAVGFGSNLACANNCRKE